MPRRRPLSLFDTPDKTDLAVESLFAQVERAGGKRARDLAERAADKALESYFRKYRHEQYKGWPARHVEALRAGLRAPEVDRAALEKHVVALDGFLGRTLRLVDRARDVVALYEPHFCEEALAPLLEEARAAAIAELGPRADVTPITLDVAPGLSLHADHPMLLRAMKELVKNAAEAYRFTAEGGEVTVVARAVRSGRAVSITVADRGHGLDPESVRYAFLPFATSKPEGTGLGKVLARRTIVDLHGGTIDVESVYGQGTTITVVLPRKQRRVQPRRRLTEEELVHEIARRERERNARAAGRRATPATTSP
jgi:signal transduction histidine kinase